MGPEDPTPRDPRTELVKSLGITAYACHPLMSQGRVLGTLSFGTRTRNDLLYFEEMKGLEKEIENFHYLPCLSREEWDGHHGYVHEIYEQLVKQKKKGEEGASLFSLVASILLDLVRAAPLGNGPLSTVPIRSIPPA